MHLFEQRGEIAYSDWPFGCAPFNFGHDLSCAEDFALGSLAIKHVDVLVNKKPLALCCTEPAAMEVPKLLTHFCWFSQNVNKACIHQFSWQSFFLWPIEVETVKILKADHLCVGHCVKAVDRLPGQLSEMVYKEGPSHVNGGLILDSRLVQLQDFNNRPWFG